MMRCCGRSTTDFSTPFSTPEVFHPRGDVLKSPRELFVYVVRNMGELVVINAVIVDVAKVERLSLRHFLLPW